MTNEEYQAIPGLSNSMMKDLAVSPLRFWYKRINPDRPVEEPTPEQQFGSAVHCAVLEPDVFNDRYACELQPPADGWLETMDDLRNWLRESGEKPRGTRKAEVIAQVQALAPKWPIAEVMRAEHAARHAGKIIFKVEDWKRIHGCDNALQAEPKLMEILKRAGVTEVPLTGIEPTTGVTLKGKLDWLGCGIVLDIKTFSQKRGKPLDKTVADAIYYEDYIRQAAVYRQLAFNNDGPFQYVLPFVESEPPHEVRLRAITDVDSLHWQTAVAQIRTLCGLYKRCYERFGEEPWIDPQEITPVQDEEFPGLIYG